MMSTRSSLNKAASALALASMLTACASSGSDRTAKVSDYRSKSVDVGLATRALAALNANDFASAISLGERAVTQSPQDAGFRSLLGNAYFGAGRFASAEQAYRDSLSLYAAQPKVMLKLALVEISLGHTAEARELIDYARDSLDAADYGLALALAGRPNDAIDVLRRAAGSATSDARVRQNLALAYALGGDWVNARVVAAQDVAPHEIDARIQQWMELAAYGSKPASRIAALTGVTPALTDPGQPIRLALAAPVEKGTAVATAEPVVVPELAPVATDVVAYAPPPPPPYYPAPEPAPVLVAASAEVAPQQGLLTVQLPEARPAPAAAPAFVAAAPTLSPAQFPYVEVRKRPARAKAVATPPAVKGAPVLKAAAPNLRSPLQKAALKTGKSPVVLQLGAYASSDRVMKAWNAASRRYATLGGYVPVSAKVAGPKGNFYRLSVRGFGNPAEATKLCSAIKRSGGACFVRGMSGDRPVQIASR
ncbi:MAG: tetratricopeptide repeat protein [Sphingomicrobium sp.]